MAAQRHFAAALDAYDAAEQQQLRSPAELRAAKAIALLGFGHPEQAIATLKGVVARYSVRETISFVLYDLLASAPNPPAGLDRMDRLLEESISTDR